MTVDKSKALKYLQKIQKRCLANRYGKDYENKFAEIRASMPSTTLGDYEKAFPNMSEKEHKAVIKAIKKSERLRKLLPQYEVPAYYENLRTVFDAVHKTANRVNLKISNVPLIGTALSQEYNALACKVPDSNNYLIVFEGELFTLSNMLVKVVIQGIANFQRLNNFSKEKIITHIDANSELQEKFADLVVNGILLGEPNRTKKYIAGQHLLQYHYNLLFSLETFVVAHEYAHIALKHLDTARLTAYFQDELKIDVLLPSWQMEYEADEVGLFLLFSSMKAENLSPFCYLGPELFFTFLDIEKRAKSFCKYGVEKRSKGTLSHPPPFERREKIRKLLNEQLQNDELEMYKRISASFEDVLEYLWIKFKINWENLKR